MRTIVVDKIASVTQACGLGARGAHRHRQHSRRGRRGRGRRGADQQGTYNTLELTSGRMAKVNKGDIVVGALGHRKALFGYSGHVPEKRQGRRHHPDAEHRRRARHLRFGQSRQAASRSTAACSASCCSSPTSASASACRRAPATASSTTTPARHPGRAGGGARRHLHGSRQDGGRLRDRQPHAPSGHGGRRLQGHRRFAAPRHPRDGGRRRAQDDDLHRSRRHHDHAKTGPALTRTMLTELRPPASRT
jgi:hypothetical protein